MSARIGLGLADEGVRAVVLRHGRLVWAAEARWEPPEPAASTMAALLVNAPVRRWPRASVRAAIGPHASQVRLVGGLPEVQDTKLLASTIRSGAGTFFLKNGVPLLTTGVRLQGRGLVWAAAVDRPRVDAIKEVCRMRSWRLQCIAPTAVVLPLAVKDMSFTWCDGPVCVEITRRDGLAEAIRTRPTSLLHASPTVPHPVDGLAQLGDQAPRYADAYGAALCELDEPLALRGSAPELQSAAERRRSYRMPLEVAAIAMTALVLSPLAGPSAAWRARRAAPVVRADQWAVMRSTLEQLDRVTSILNDTRNFDAARPDVVGLLASVTRALPASGVLTEFELEADTVRVNLQGPDGAALLAALRRASGVSGVEVMDSISHETTPTGPVERLSVRMRLDTGAVIASPRAQP